MKSSVRRPYRMTARAAAAAATGERILDAAVAAFWERPGEDLVLEDVARRAEVSVQTVIRRFGGRAGLIEACIRRESARVRREREAPPGDLAEAVRAIVRHYEQIGDRVLALLAAERRLPVAAEVAEAGRAEHRRWCERVFAPVLDRLAGAERARRLAQLVAVCDVYTWKLLRRDAGLDVRQTELALRELLQPLIEEGR